VHRLRVVAVLAMCPLFFCMLSCRRGQPSSSRAEAPRDQADSLGSEILLPDGFSTEEVDQAKAARLTLPTNFGRQTGDIDQMLKVRNIRALVTINPISFFYSHGKPRGLLYEQLEELQREVNKKYKRGKLKIKVSFIPVRPDELGPALAQGVGDLIAADMVITPERQKYYAFTVPIMKNVTHIIVTGPQLAKASSLDDLGETDIYVSQLSGLYDDLMRINEERAKAGKARLSVKVADKNLQEDDLVEMVNAGLIPATVAMQHRAELWEQILPNVRLHRQMIIGSDDQLGWVLRKDSPEFKKLLDQFTATHGEGTLFGNTLLRRYLKNTKWIKDSTSQAEMKKFATNVKYFRQHAAQYQFDYLMIVALGYQESRLDQSRRSPTGAVGIMQVIPKYAAAKPISVPDVRTADKNILAGVRMLNNFATHYFNDPGIDEFNKTLFTFASYNAGPSRVAGLCRRAEKDGLDPKKWFDNVELEAAKEIGEETVTYVDNVYKYYVAYKLAEARTLETQKAKATATGN
jgi:membrane-bound lytic murein transglycosylase MltF